MTETRVYFVGLAQW